MVREMQSETDALQILSMASPRRDSRLELAPADQVVPLEEFVLIQKGYVSSQQLISLTEVFFNHHHHFYVG